ncbi:sodium-dependent transporter [Methylococcus sp. EFPC2]|uniref:sodium-dependent transporter n=1 Tax=Methylococcus sp. EFPC2 TaxID=2812648 RepID=UPI0019676DA7|nr:sodium-dependent transporter [Methylococcus sp. EFPC2]QSA97614.1 sodium-dependent transporter [Methylococcus sp. EFPC2]
MTDQRLLHAQWSSRTAFILAASGSAIGLGNIWKFPYLAGEFGGGAFVVTYLLCVALIGVPIMIAETLLGRRGRQSPINTMLTLAEEAKASPYWRYTGWLGVAAGFLILSYYSVIAGWAMAYIFKINSALFVNIDAEQTGRFFEAFKSSPEFQSIWHTLFMIATVAIVSRGVSGGLERASRYLMPALFAMLVALDVYAMNSGGFGRGFAFLFYPDFDKLTGEGVLAAMGQAFFSLGLGMGSIMVYGSYLPSHVSIARSSLFVASADTVVALMAGLAIFPLVFAHGLEPGMGPGLIFQTLPIAFGQMPAGWLFGMVFFVLVFFAAITSAVALIEPAVAWLSENLGLSRKQASLYAGAACWFIGLGSAFSFNIWSEVKLFGKTVFELVDFLTANLMLPLGGVLVALFAGWVMKREISEAELELGEGRAYPAWRVLIRYVAPLGVLMVFLDAFGVL